MGLLYIIHLINCKTEITIGYMQHSVCVIKGVVCLWGARDGWIFLFTVNFI